MVHRKSTPSSVMNKTAIAAADERGDVVILCNGPGEVVAWVKPVVAAVREKCPVARVSVMLTPCPHASGGELRVLDGIPGVERAQGPGGFFHFLLQGRTEDGWDWHPVGVVIYLGGDQLYCVLAARRLGYRSVAYAETVAMWPGLVDRYAVRSAEILSHVPKRLRRKCAVVGDLLADQACGHHHQRRPENLHPCLRDRGVGGTHDRGVGAEGTTPPCVLIGLLPGSKPIKLAIGVPYMLDIADIMVRSADGASSSREGEAPASELKFVLPLAPTTSLQELKSYLPDGSSLVQSSIVSDESDDVARVCAIATRQGTHIEVWAFGTNTESQFRFYEGMTLAITTPGTNTAELGALGIPMLVVLPTQYVLQTFKGASGGVLNILGALPGRTGRFFTGVMNRAILAENSGQLSWPNKWLQRPVVPELVGDISPTDVALVALEHLRNNGRKCARMREELADLRFSGNAALRIADLVREQLLTHPVSHV